MATLVSIATGNFTSSATWGVVDSTSLLDSEAGSSVVSTSNLDSATFTTGIITVSGVAVKLAARAASPSGTFTVTLRNSTGSVDVASVTVNVSDLPAAGLGWCYFKFASSQALLAATNYIVRVVCSATGSQVTLYRNATANNHSRLLVTTTTQAPAAGDQLAICGEFTGAGTANAVTVTMDSTATTVYGATSYTQAITINAGGKLTYGTSASTTYILKYAGLFDVMAGGTLEIGTVSTPMPATSIGRLDLSVAANVDTGLRVRSGGTLIGQGASKTTKAWLAANASASATTITTDVSTGWKSGDSVVIPSTSRTYSEYDQRTLSGDASGTTVTLNSGLTNAHLGTAPTIARVVNLTRNVLIQGTSDSLQGYIVFEAGAIVDWDYVEVYRMGSATTAKRGFDVQTTTGTVNLNGCSLHDFVVTSSIGLNLTAATGSALTVTNMVSYNIEREHFYAANTSTGTWSIDGWVAIRSASSQIPAFEFLDCGGTAKNLYAASINGPGFHFNERNGVPVDFSNWEVHSVFGFGIICGGAIGELSGTNRVWRCNSGGISVAVSHQGPFLWEFKAVELFGNTSANFDIRGNAGLCRFSNCAANGDSTFSTAAGVQFVLSSSGGIGYEFISCSLGAASGIRTTHATGDILVQSGNLVQARFINCTFGSATRLSGQTALGNFPIPFLSIEPEHSIYFGMGTVSKDATISRTATPSIRLAPLSASVKLPHAILGRGAIAAAVSGASRTISVYVRKSAAGDGAAYNGSQPRLLVRRNDLIGIAADSVLATASGSAGAWELLTASTPTPSADGAFEFVVDCDGTAGWVNVDDWAVS